MTVQHLSIVAFLTPFTHNLLRLCGLSNAIHNLNGDESTKVFNFVSFELIFMTLHIRQKINLSSVISAFVIRNRLDKQI